MTKIAFSPSFFSQQCNSRVDNKERKESVQCAIYAPYKMFASSNMTSSVAHVTIALGAKLLIFLRTVKRRGVFVSFVFMNACFLVLSASIFSRNRACVSLHSRPCPWRTIWSEHSHWSIFEFLARDFPQTSYTEHITRWTLSSLSLLSSLGVTGRNWNTVKSRDGSNKKHKN